MPMLLQASAYVACPAQLCPALLCCESHDQLATLLSSCQSHGSTHVCMVQVQETQAEVVGLKLELSAAEQVHRVKADWRRRRLPA